MSTQLGKEIEYCCSDDCKQTGCPGHKAQVIMRNTSDTMEILISGESILTVNDAEWDAILKSYESLKLL